MKTSLRYGWVLLPMAGLAAANVPECTDEQLLALVPSANEVDEHRGAPLPGVAYSYGTRRKAWGFELILRVNDAGRVECYAEPPPGESYDPQRGIQGPRQAIIQGLPEWRYTPFLRDGRPVPVVLTETLREFERPGRRRKVPEVPLAQVRISLERSMCFGTCPDYRIELHGDGRAIFTGNGYTVVRGEHAYSVDPAKVALLVERLRATDVWSARSRYHAPITDGSTNKLRIQLGKHVRSIDDYFGEWIGMPASVDEFESAVDEAAGASGFIHLSTQALEALQREGFRFDSLEGAKLFSRAVNDEEADDTALARVVELGAPLTLPPGTEEAMRRPDPGPALLSALRYRRGKTVEAMLARDALALQDGASQSRIDAAFRAAIEGGDIALVKRIWGIQGELPHPSMTFEEEGGSADSQPKPRRNTDVITLIARGHGAKTGDHIAIADFLASHGSDLRATRANGYTLLHAASQVEDVGFVRFLLSKGLDVSATNPDGTSPLGMTYSEEVSMVLIEAGADLSKMSSEHYSYRNFVQARGWYRVLARLDAQDK